MKEFSRRVETSHTVHPKAHAKHSQTSDKLEYCVYLRFRCKEGAAGWCLEKTEGEELADVVVLQACRCCTGWCDARDIHIANSR